MVLIDTYLNGDCTLTIKRAQLTKAQFFARQEQLHMLAASDIAAKATGGDPTITTHQRLWDLGGINLLNEWDLTLTWSYDGHVVYNASGYASYYAKKEPPPDVGWWLDNYILQWINGCNGCQSIELWGYGDFKYSGLFDNTGKYENEYNNCDTGNFNGTHSYLMTYHWKNGFPGWHMQQWCC